MLLGILLAGGLSSRMGTDKALLNWCGEAQLSRAMRQLSEVGCDQVVVSRNQSGFIQDKFVNHGPVAGIHAALDQVQCDEALVIPVDMPLLDSISLIELLSVGRDAVHSCYYSNSVLPCYLNNPMATLSVAERRLVAGERSVHGLLQALHAQSVNPTSTLNLFNTNTPHEWQTAQQLAVQHQGRHYGS
jgi:molybdopterin-guanine dinucleotide biosynthesis protein A